MFLRRTCRDISRLLVEREARPLGTAERLTLRLHLLACGACSRFDQQMRLMNQAFSAWRQIGTGEDGEAKPPREAPRR